MKVEHILTPWLFSAVCKASSRDLVPSHLFKSLVPFDDPSQSLSSCSSQTCSVVLVFLSVLCMLMAGGCQRLAASHPFHRTLSLLLCPCFLLLVVWSEEDAEEERMVRAFSEQRSAWECEWRHSRVKSVERQWEAWM